MTSIVTRKEWIRVPEGHRLDLREGLPLLAMHLLGFLALAVRPSAAALAALAVTYAVRVFALTGGYHRYFSHNAFRTGRVFQFVLAFLGATAAQLGPLWWASHHRRHHAHSDTPADLHSPTLHGFFWSHLGWLFCRSATDPEYSNVQDFAKYPEIRWLDRHTWVAYGSLALLLWGVGEGLRTARPEWGTSGLQFVAWGFFVSTLLVYHVTFSINSLMHLFGSRRYATADTSRNNPVLAILSFGEGWHNNHHRYPVSARQGFRWWEIDITYYVLRLLGAVGLVWEIREPPARVLRETAS